MPRKPLGLFKLTIKPEHLDRAISAISNRKEFRRLRDCVLGQAAQDMWGKHFTACSSNEICLDHYKVILYALTQDKVAMCDIVNYFDNNNFDAVRVRLPLTVRLKRVP